MSLVSFAASRAARQLIHRRSLSKRYFSSYHEKILTDINPETGICKMTLNGGPANILDSEMLEAAVKAIKFAETSKEVRGIMLTSNFDGKVFCAGLNIMDLYQKSHEHVFNYWTRVQDWYLSWYGCSKPTVAAINGHAVAGGCAWTLMCDYRIMQAGTGRKIGLNETRLGLMAPFFLVDLITATLNHRPSELILLQGMLLESEDALKIGLVDDTANLDELAKKATKQLNSFMSIPPQAYSLTKLLLREKNLKKVPGIREEDAKNIADFVTSHKVQERLRKYISALKSRKEA